jgi:hypothetical protein
MPASTNVDEAKVSPASRRGDLAEAAGLLLITAMHLLFKKQCWVSVQNLLSF